MSEIRTIGGDQVEGKVQDQYKYSSSLKIAMLT